MDVAEDDLVAKYDSLASAYSARYVDPEAIAGFFVHLVRSWLTPVASGAMILEVSCADGFMTEALVRAGFRVLGIDLSPGMVDAARKRLAAKGLEADLRVADIRSFEPDGDIDVLLAPMWTFYHYVDDPAGVLRRLAPSVRTKAIVDLDPRAVGAGVALDDLRAAGFARVGSRPVAVPNRVRIGRTGRAILDAALRLGPVRAAVLSRRLNVAACGVKP